VKGIENNLSIIIDYTKLRDLLTHITAFVSEKLKLKQNNVILVDTYRSPFIVKGIGKASQIIPYRPHLTMI
jgi:hypothetical protein